MNYALIPLRLLQTFKSWFVFLGSDGKPSHPTHPKITSQLVKPLNIPYQHITKHTFTKVLDFHSTGSKSCTCTLRFTLRTPQRDFVILYVRTVHLITIQRTWTLRRSTAHWEESVRPSRTSASVAKRTWRSHHGKEMEMEKRLEIYCYFWKGCAFNLGFTRYLPYYTQESFKVFVYVEPCVQGGVETTDTGRTALDNKTSLLNTMPLLSSSPRPTREYQPVSYSDSSFSSSPFNKSLKDPDQDVESLTDGKTTHLFLFWNLFWSGNFGLTCFLLMLSTDSGVDQSEMVAELLKELSNHSERVEERKAALCELMRLIRETQLHVWDEHFKTILLLLLETLGDGEVRARTVAYIHVQIKFKSDSLCLRFLACHPGIGAASVKGDP